MATLIGDRNINLGVLALEGAFSIKPQIGQHGSRKGLLRFRLDCEQPAFIDSMYATATTFARRNRGKVESPRRGRAAATLLLVFDAPPRDASFGDLYLNLATQLFKEVRDAFMGWQVEHHLMGAAGVAAISPGERRRLRLVHNRPR